MLLTICTIRQLPQALALGDSFSQYATHGKPEPILIGLADDLIHLPVGFTSPYPLLPISELMPATQLAALSAIYTPTEFTAACKPLFIAEALRRYPDMDRFLYADPNIQFFAPIATIWSKLANASLLLTPHITRSLIQKGPSDKSWPDEKHFQNVGLYSSDFLAFRRSPEMDRLLVWWDDRVRERAYVDFCAGFCLDQLWLMHVPIFFRDVLIEKNPGWHVALWNLPERAIQQQANGWSVNGPSGQNQPVQFVNFKGLLNPDEGLFPHQNRINISQEPNILALINAYRQALSAYKTVPVEAIIPAYGQQPEPVILRGWRYTIAKSMRAVTHFLDRVYLPTLT